MSALTVVQDLREYREPVSAEELEQFETDVLAGFVWPGPRPGYGRHDPR
ncbi:hypothetical protein ABT126_39405 [Streptomyces sp. NPDC002012]